MKTHSTYENNTKNIKQIQHKTKIRNIAARNNKYKTKSQNIQTNENKSNIITNETITNNITYNIKT